MECESAEYVDGMAKRSPSRKTATRRRTFLKQWRKYRDLTQAEAADRIGVKQATLSRIERGLIPYTQDFLEAAAAAYQCEPEDLIMRNPEDPGALWSIWEGLEPDDRRRAVELMKGLKRASGE